MKNKLFIPRKLSDDDSRYSDWNNSQPVVNGVRINQYDLDGRKQGYWESYYLSGQLQSKGNYVNGEADGYWEYHWRNGSIIYEKYR
jgi:antitoxin component YwqK of YwqJK toxin-antitoxin module